MPDVVALEFEARAAALAELLQDVLDVLEGVAEDEVAAALQMLRLPGELELLELVEGGIEPEIHRSHVERAHLRLGAQRRGQALSHAHPGAAARGDVHHRVARLLDRKSTRLNSSH